MRLFIDVDDTLILYDAEGEIHPYGFLRGEAYHINETLVAFVRRFRAQYPDAIIIIWSGGGQDYAHQAMNEAFVDVDLRASLTPMIKDQTTFTLVRLDDIVIDDQAIDVPALVTPPDFFEGIEWGVKALNEGRITPWEEEA